MGNVKGDNNYAIDVERLYENVMNRYKYGGLDTPGLYLDETTLRTCYYHRRLFAQLAKELIRQGDNTSSQKGTCLCRTSCSGVQCPRDL